VCGGGGGRRQRDMRARLEAQAKAQVKAEHKREHKWQQGSSIASKSNRTMQQVLLRCAARDHPEVTHVPLTCSACAMAPSEWLCRMPLPLRPPLPRCCCRPAPPPMTTPGLCSAAAAAACAAASSSLLAYVSWMLRDMACRHHTLTASTHIQGSGGKSIQIITAACISQPVFPEPCKLARQITHPVQVNRWTLEFR
jgi:hypothetical protein